MKHFLIATATSSYANLRPEEARPQLTAVLASIVDLFTRRVGGYQRELATIAENPSSDALRKALDRWFAAPERDPADWVVLYYTGHAEVVDPYSLYLLTSDYEPYQYASTAFSVQQLADIVLATRGDRQPRRVRNLLVIVDTCFAGEGIAELAEKLSAVFRRSSGSSFYMLGAALPREEAQAGALAKALIESIEELVQRYTQQEWLYLEQLVPAINRRLRTHAAILSIVVSAREEPRFFRNPNYLNTAGRAIPASDAQRAIADREFRDHWGPRARGVEFDSQPGSYFSGRTAVLDELARFFNSADDHRTRVVTGRPGAGKSAVLSRIVSPESWQLLNIPAVDLAVHAKGKTLADVTTRLADFCGVAPKTQEILDRLKEWPRPLCVVVDALDEAAEPTAIAEQILAPMSAVQSVKLLVGTRESQVARFRGATIIDIDKPEYASKDDIGAYVKARLLRTHEPPQPTPYAGRDTDAARVAEIVAGKAYPNFLVARLIAEDLLSKARAVNPDLPADVAFPTKVADAFDGYLRRFGANESLVRDVLTPLAYAEGEGLPWDNIWAPLASALGRREYGDADIRWVLKEAGAFVLESTENGRSVYRLYHQALADALRRGRRGRSVHAAFVKALTAATPRLPGSAGVDWLTASRYVRSHLATHAAASGALPKLLRDPLYVLAADATRLLSAIYGIGDRAPREVVAVYRGAVRHIREEPPESAAAHLELIARQRGLHEFADAVASLPLDRPWSVPWAWWSPGAASQSFAKADSRIRELVAAEWAGRPIALIGRADGGVEAWDVALGERLAGWKPNGVALVVTLAMAESAKGPLVLASWDTGHVGAYNLVTGENVVRDGGGEQAATTAMCVAARGGEWVCVTAHGDRRLVVRHVSSLEPIVERADATPTKVYGLRAMSSGDETVLVGAADSVSRERDDIASSMLHVWRLADLTLVWEDERHRTGALHYIESSDALGEHVVVISQNHFGPCQLWDVAQKRLLFEGTESSAHAWVHRVRGEVFLIEQRFRELVVRRVESSKEEGVSFAVIDHGEVLETEGDQYSSIFRLHGRPTLLSTVTDHVRVWDLDDLISTRRQNPIQSRVFGRSIKRRITSAAGVASARGHQIVAGGAGRIIAFDAASGGIAWERQVSGERAGAVWVRALSVMPRGELMAGTDDGSLYRLANAEEDQPTKIVAGHRTLERACAVEWNGQPLAFVTTESGRAWEVRIWNLSTGAEVPTSRAYRLTHGEEDKRMRGLAAIATDRGVRFAFASSYGKVMVADFVGPIDRPAAWPRAYDEWRVPGAGEDYIDALAADPGDGVPLLAAGSANGDLAIWNFATGETIASRAAAHLGGIDILSWGRIGSVTVLASGGDDGIVRLWTTELEELCRIVVGERVSALAWTTDGGLAAAGSRGVAMLSFSEIIARTN